MTILQKDYFMQEDVVAISQDLIGKSLMTHIDGHLTGGVIVETEAYRAPNDKASHAYNFRRTPKNEAMYHQGGTCYVYICYGIHHLFNIVTNQADVPHAILIRAIQPTTGIETMLQRRKKTKLDRSIAGGPGAMSQALGISIAHNKVSLSEDHENSGHDKIWIEQEKSIVSPKDILASPRVGVAYAEEDASLPWRFRLNNSPWTSNAK